MIQLSRLISITHKATSQFPVPTVIHPENRVPVRARSPKEIQGQFEALLPVDHSIAYSPTGTQEKTHQFQAFMHDIY